MNTNPKVNLENYFSVINDLRTKLEAEVEDKRKLERDFEKLQLELKEFDKVLCDLKSSQLQGKRNKRKKVWIAICT